MNETTTTTTNDAPLPTAPSTHPPLVRAATMPTTPISPLATTPWYRQKFELYRDVIEEKVHNEYPDLPQTHQLEPANIEHSTTKGYDLDFPIELHDGRKTVVSVAYSSVGNRPPYTKEERRNLVEIRRYSTPNS